MLVLGFDWKSWTMGFSESGLASIKFAISPSSGVNKHIKKHVSARNYNELLENLGSLYQT